MAALLQLQAISQHYGALKAVDEVDITVAGGEALAVIGPNGAGKTTLFNLITGDAAPTKGRIEFGGLDVTAMPPHARSRLGVGRSYQIPHPFANMSVFENLLVGAIFGGGVSERESYKRCSEVLKVTGLYDKANMPARRRPLLRRKRLEKGGGGGRERESQKALSEGPKVPGLYEKTKMPARTLTLLQRKRLEMARALAM